MNGLMKYCQMDYSKSRQIHKYIMYVNGWIDGWMDGWVDRRMDGWTDG